MDARTGSAGRRHGPGEVECPVGGDDGSTLMYGSDRIVDLLRVLGCKYIPGNPGSSFRGLHDSIVNYGGNRDPQFLLCHNELIAVSMAHGYAKSAQRPGVAVVHDLVGIMQASMGMYNAYIDEVPLILLGGGGPADTTFRRPVDWIHSASAQAQLVREFIKWDAEPVDQVGMEDAVAEAWRRATTAPQGPVYVTLDVAVQEKPLTELARSLPSGLAEAPRGLALEAEDVLDIVDALLSAERPAIVVGPMGYSARATDAVVRLATPLAAACLDVDHATVFPTAFELNVTQDYELLADADLILALGVRDIRAVLEPVLGRRLGTVLREGLETRVLDVGLRDLTMRGWASGGSSSARVAARYLADPIVAAEQLGQGVASGVAGRDPDWPAQRRRRRSTIAQRHRALVDAGQAKVRERWDEHPISPGRLVAELWDAVRDTPWQLVMRNTRTFPTGVWDFANANDYLGHSGGAGIGYGPGAMVGAALGAMETGRLAVGIDGDGDFLMHPGALWTAVHYRIPMLLVINDNRSFYNDEDHQVAVARDRGRPEENGHIGMRMVQPATDIAALARGYGAWAAGPIENPEELAESFAAGVRELQRGRTALVHVLTAPT